MIRNDVGPTRIPTRTFDFRTFTSRPFDIIGAGARTPAVVYTVIMRYYFRTSRPEAGEKENFSLSDGKNPENKNKTRRAFGVDR